MKTAVVYIERRSEACEIADWLDAQLFEYSTDIFVDLFHDFECIVALMACGIAVRKIAPLIRDKWTDPAVVIVTPDLRYSIPISGGHHGGNEMAKKLSQYGITPVISTATDASGKDSVEEIAARNDMEIVNKSSTVSVNKAFLMEDVPVYRIDGPAVAIVSSAVSIISASGEYVVGIGCNRDTSAKEIVMAVEEALLACGIEKEDVLAFTSTVKKSDEKGMLQAIRELGARLFLVDDEAINSQPVASRSKAELLGLIGVAEPSALALSKRKELIMERRAYGNVTIAIAR